MIHYDELWSAWCLLRRDSPWLPEQTVLSASLGGAVARYAADGDRPAQAISLEETMRRAPARDNADGHEMREPYRGYDVGPAKRIGY